MLLKRPDGVRHSVDFGDLGSDLGAAEFVDFIPHVEMVMLILQRRHQVHERRVGHSLIMPL